MDKLRRLCVLAVCVLLLGTANVFAQTGGIQGKVVDEHGLPLPFVNVVIVDTFMGSSTNAEGEFSIANVPPGPYTLQVRHIGYKATTANVTVAANQTVTHDFTLIEDVLMMQDIVVTGTRTPRPKMESSVAISTVSAAEMRMANPRSTTEVLRYIPGFTRVESSGGEVNQNVSVRGIFGVEYVMFMEDGLPVFPTMHTFFMNADNLFRLDENIGSTEVVRGGNSALFGSNTPGAIVNFINKTGGAEVGGVAKMTAASEDLVRYDFNLNGPLSPNWRFNVGGFYRHDQGVRNPGFIGIRGGQFKANVTRLFENGYVRGSVKMIDDRNQFILPLPFENPEDPRYVEGFGDYGAMTSNEGNHISVPTPEGRLELPLDNGLRTKANWFTIDANFAFPGDWELQNIAQVMQNDQEWNAIVPFNVLTAEDWISSLNLAGAPQTSLFFTNHVDEFGSQMAFDTGNNLVAPGGEWHVEKPLSAFQDQLTLNKKVGDHTYSAGFYFANYSQTNRWYFTEVLTDVRDNPRFLDLVAVSGADTLAVTKNGFRRYISNYVNGSGTTTIFSAVASAELRLMQDLRLDLGARYEWSNYVQTSENTSPVDLDDDPATTYDNIVWGNDSYRHFERTLDDWAGSIGLNYSLSPNLALYAQGSRAFKMPALDEFLNASAQAQVELFEAQETLLGEGGVKYSGPMFGFALNGFWGELKNIVGQGAEVDTLTGEIFWRVRTSPQSRSYGAELEFSINPIPGGNILAAGTWLQPQTVPGTGSALTAGGIPRALFNVAGTYNLFGNLTLLADWHFVGARELIVSEYDAATEEYTTYRKVGELPAYGYLNVGLSYAFPRQGVLLSVDVLNITQSIGLEEGNPRLPAAGGANLFLARPILPTRAMLTVRYQF